MRLNKILVKNFRSIKNLDLSVGLFNIFVGQNNHGKSNLFEALNWFFNGPRRGESLNDIRFGRRGEEEVLVDVEFVDAQSGLAYIKDAARRTKFEKMLDGEDSFSVKRSSTDPRKRQICIAGEWLDKNPSGFDKTLNEFLPKFEYIDTKTYLSDVSKYSKNTPIGVMLADVLTAILETSKRYKKFHDQFDELFDGDESEVKNELDCLSGKVQECLGLQFPDCTRVQFEVAQPQFEDLLKNFGTAVDDGVLTSAHEKGDGMQRALMFAILQVYADFRKSKGAKGKPFMFFIDEAELHLHPTAQRKLKDVLCRIVDDGDQVFVNTHSSVLVADATDNQQIFRVEKVEKETQIDLTDESDKPYIIYDLLGGQPTDLLLPNNFLIVEGKSEFLFLTNVIKRFYSHQPSIQIVEANGDSDQANRSINALEHLFKPLKRSLYGPRVVLLFDSPKKVETLQTFYENHPKVKSEGRGFVLPTHSLEEYYPDVNGWCRVVNKGLKKVKLAVEVGQNITQEQFEQNMSVVFDALQKVWSLSYQSDISYGREPAGLSKNAELAKTTADSNV